MIKNLGIVQKRISSKVVISAAIAIMLIELVVSVIIPQMGANPLITIGVARAFEIAAMVAILMLMSSGLKSAGLQKDDFVLGLKTGLIWSVLFGLFALLILGVLYLSGYNIIKLLAYPLKKTALSTFLLFVIGGFVSPIAEEIFFRGIIFGSLRRWGAILAIVGSTTFFAIAHLLTSGLSPLHIIGGMVFALAYEIEKNLLVPITIHVLGNMSIFALSIFPFS